MNTRLGISIPTYKRPDQLLATVRSVIANARAFEVPIVISDDSTDDTNREVYSILRNEYPLIRVSRNPSNLGIDGNILHCVDINPCEYVWLLGEDDRLVSGAVDRILSVLASADTPFIYVNYASVDAGFQQTLKAVSLRLNADGSLPAEAFWQTSAWSAGFIGGCVVRKRDWERIDPAPYLGTWFAHVGRIMAMSRGYAIHLVADPLVLNRCGTTEIFTWTGSLMDVLDGWRRLCRSLEPLYSKAACDASLAAFRRAHGLGTLRFLAYARAGGALTPDVVRNQILPGDESPVFKQAARLIARLPVTWFRALQQFKHRRTSACPPPPHA